jgi:hypothetical protein
MMIGSLIVAWTIAQSEVTLPRESSIATEWAIPFPPWWYTIPAILFSLFYGLSAFKIFDAPTCGKHWTWVIHQIWFNLLGAATGWSALWVLYLRAAHQDPFDIWNLLLFVLAFIGITGHMPRTIVGLVLAPGEIFAKLVGGK